MRPSAPPMPALRVSLGSLRLANPVLAAAGTFGYGVEFVHAVPLERLGALVTKTLTRRPRAGNPPPRLVETPSGLLNSVGLQNIGLDAFLTEKLPMLRQRRVPVIVSVLAESAEDVVAMVQRLDRAEGVLAIELNLSCPNTRWGQGNSGQPLPLAPRPLPLLVAQVPDATALMVKTAREHTTKPLIAKLSPDVTDLAPIAQAAERAGADILAVANTFTGMSLDPDTGRSRLGALTGGLSGPAIRPLAVYRVWYTARVVRLPIIGSGGIARADDALEFFRAGASAVAIGTANFAHPGSPLRVLQGLERYMVRHRIETVQALQGSPDVARAPA